MKQKRVKAWVKREIASLIERYFGAKGYRIDRCSLRAGGPKHLRVRHIDKDQDAVERDWDVISALVTKEFGWTPDIRWEGHHNDFLLILNGTL